MNPERTVLFDLGNVLVRIDHSVLWRALGLPESVVRSPLAGKVWTLAHRYESGACTTDEFLQEAFAALDGSFAVAQIRDAFMKIIGEPIPGMAELVARVSQRARVALASNTNEMHHEFSRRHVPALAVLPNQYVSYRIGAMKPDVKYYEAIVQNEGRDPQMMVFIDDREENVAAATKLGMRGILFEGKEKLREVLRTIKLV